jgi:predicted metal-dependent hydrolase
VAETQTPADLVIRPRDLAFGRGSNPARWWHGGDPIATAFFNALSASFPQGERFFMDAVRPWRETAGPELREQIRVFTAQEAVHSREHLVFNNQVASAGFDFGPIDTFLKRRFDLARKLPRLTQLAATIALEHFTAILANVILKDSEHLAGARAELKRMWQWHAIEEVEHKAVAFDTFMFATEGFWPLRRWWIRSFSMVLATLMFFQYLAFGAREFLRRDGIDNPGAWRALLSYLFVRPGIMRRVAPSYFTYYRPGFHPWRVDDRALIADVEISLAPSHAAA